MEKETRISVRIQPGASRNEAVGETGGVWRIRVAAPPREGKANRELIEFLSDKLGIAKSRINIVRGENARDKVMSISGLSEEDVKKHLAGNPD